MVKNKFGGYVIARKLYDYDDKLKPFAYYPKKAGERAPYVYPTEAQAKKVLNSKRDLTLQRPGNVVVKYTKKVYLDRY